MIIVGIYGADFNGDINHPIAANLTNSETGKLTEADIHDSGCTIFIHGKHICSVNEERLSRIKYDGEFPHKSINHCLEYAGITGKDVDIVYYVTVYNTAVPFHYDENLTFKNIKPHFPNAKIRFCGHHLAHASSTVFTSPYNEGTFLTFDGGGSGLYDPYRSEIPYVENNSIGYFNKEKKIFRFYNMPDQQLNNFGNYYSHVASGLYAWKMQKKTESRTDFISSVGKIMGLSAYGSLDKYKGGFESGFSVIDHSIPYITFPQGGWFNPPDTPEEGARWLQKSFEDGMLSLLKGLRKYHLDETTCFAGGTFLNIVANTLIKESGLFKNIHIPPFTDDAGLHFGAAAWGCFEENETIDLPENISLLGRDYSNDQIKEYLDAFGLSYVPYDANEVAVMLSNQKIVGWFQGRSEHGPRALGSRSIFMSPAVAENKDILNERVKHRESWRPFAGIIREQDVSEYFEEGFITPYMLYIQTSKTDKIPAITHMDKSCRIQTVNSDQNPKVYDLLGRLETPVILNTSFNDNGEPIVETPYHAISSFLKMNIDVLVIGDFIVNK
jgi:carbamoyltransferase